MKFKDVHLKITGTNEGIQIIMQNQENLTDAKYTNPDLHSVFA